jgi:NADPH:quinone reductase-like Zn-dependent oxidoreductase
MEHDAAQRLHIFEHAAKLGVSSALLSSKKKTISLLSRGATISLTPEEAPAEWVDRLGPVPAIYSREINYWTFRAAIDILKRRPENLATFLARSNREDLTIMGELMATRKVTPVIDRRFSLSEVPEAPRYLEEGHARGKVVITLEQNNET